MNQIFMYIGFGSFAVIPAILLLAIYFARKRIGILLILIMIAGGGWLSINMGNYFLGEYMCEMAQSTMAEARHERACFGDGARDVSTFLLGWLYSLIYSIPFLAVYGVSCQVRRKREAQQHAT